MLDKRIAIHVHSFSLVMLRFLNIGDFFLNVCILFFRISS